LRFQAASIPAIWMFWISHDDSESNERYKNHLVEMS
jgi:hypothetical protein